MMKVVIQSVHELKQQRNNHWIESVRNMVQKIVLCILLEYFFTRWMSTRVTCALMIMTLRMIDWRPTRLNLQGCVT